MNVNYTALVKKIKGTFVPKPISGTLSGHSAGEPFDKHVYSEIKKQLPNNTFRQYEYLNDLDSKNAEIIGIEARQALFNSPSVLFLLSRGKEATKNWSLENPFDEKQDDTADILVVKDGFYEIIDIKTRNLSKTAQAPNIISAFKLAQLCAIMLDNKEFKSLSINYFEVDWLLEHDKLVCKDAHFVNLFKSIRHKMGKSKSIAKIVGPTLIVMVFSEMRFWNPTLYDTQIVPLIIFRRVFCVKCLNINRLCNLNKKTSLTFDCARRFDFLPNIFNSE